MKQCIYRYFNFWSHESCKSSAGKSGSEYDPEGAVRRSDKPVQQLERPNRDWIWLLCSKVTAESAIIFNTLDKLADYDFVEQSVLDAILLMVIIRSFVII